MSPLQNWVLKSPYFTISYFFENVFNFCYFRICCLVFSNKRPKKRDKALNNNKEFSKIYPLHFNQNYPFVHLLSSSGPGPGQVRSGEGQEGQEGQIWT